VTSYTYVDFCAGAGGPTPIIEADLNAQLSSGVSTQTTTTGSSLFTSSNNHVAPHTNGYSGDEAVKFVLTDLHPHIPDWTEAAKKSSNLSFISTPVDAANAPADLLAGDNKKVFRLFNLAFHHFDDDLARAILKNTIETSDGFG
jgi:hypothetical protein